MSHIIYISFIFLFSCNVQAKILVLEYIGNDMVQDHGKSVESIACNLNPENCFTFFTHTFNKETLNFLFESKSENFSAVNMSFGWEKPSFNNSLSFKLSNDDFFAAKEKYNQTLKEYNEGIPLLSEMMTSNPETLFVAAAGNGVSISFIQTLGVAINEKTELYPSALTASNLIKVSAITLPQIDPHDIPNYEIAPYANFGLDFVEIAAPVEPDFTGKAIKGTSFSAPFISRVADEMKQINPLLKPEEMSEILMKSCHIKNIDKAIEASLDLAAKGIESDVYQAMFNKKEKYVMNYL